LIGYKLEITIPKKIQGRATHRKRKNTIVKLKKADGNLCTSDEEMRAMAKSFYLNLYSSEEAVNVEQILEHIPVGITDDMNDCLGVEVTDEETESALFQMGPTKGTGARWSTLTLLPKTLVFGQGCGVQGCS
jgi:hypothetical protein